MMWNYQEYNGKLNFFKINISSTKEVEYFVSDLLELWCEVTVLDDLLTRAKALNKRIEYDDDTIMRTLKSAPLQWDFQEYDEDIALSLKYYVDKIPFYFKWNLQKCSREEYKQHILRPAFLSIGSLSKQNEELLNIIKKKDVEIQQYKIEGAVLKRDKVQTEPFSEDEFRVKYSGESYKSFVKYACDSYEDVIKVSENSKAMTSNPKGSNVEPKPSGSPRKRGRKIMQHTKLIRTIEKDKLAYTDSDTPPAVDDAEIIRSLKELQRLQKEDMMQKPQVEPSKSKLTKRKFDL